MIIGFIGLGNMGGPMAINLLKAGHELKVFDMVPEKVQEVVAEGATAVETAADAAKDVECLISMLPASQHVYGLYVDKEALFDVIKPGTLVIDSSTIAPETARQVAKLAADKGINMLDAPVSGGTAGAAAGTLTFMVGGSKENLEKAMPILTIMGQNIFHAGSNGAGLVVKICNNMLLSVIMAGTAEAVQLAVNSGLDPKVASGIMAKATGRSWVLDVANPYPGVLETAPSSKGYVGGFMTELMAKDSNLAQDAVLQTKSSAPLGALARNLFAMNCQQGNGKLDFSSIIKLFQ